MDNLADYEAWKAKQRQAGVGAAQTVLGSVDASPDEVAGDLNLASEYSKTVGGPVPPAPLVKEYRPVFQQAIERHKAGTILSSSPVLAGWLRNPENAGVARDSLEGLSWWETAFGAGKNALSRGVRRIPQSYDQFLASSAAQRLADQQQGIGGIIADETAVRGADGETAYQSLPDPLDLLRAGSRYMVSRLSSAFGKDEAAAATYFQQRAGEIAQNIAAVPMSPAGERYRSALSGLKPSGDVQQDFWQFARTIADDPGGFASFLAETAAESMPSLAAAAAVTAATRSPAAGASVMGSYSFATEAGTGPVEFLREKGIDVSTPEGAARAISDPDLMREANERGLTRGVVVGIMDGLSGGVASKVLAQNPVANIALQSVVQATFGAGGEAGAQLAAGQQFNLSDVLIEGLAEFVTAPVEVAGVGGQAFIDRAGRVREATATAGTLQQISAQAAANPLRERMPDKFREFVARVTADTPAENLYVPADQFVQFFQGNGIDPYTAIEQMDGVTADDLDAALAGGGDLQIPTATYAAKIAGTEYEPFFVENARFDPDQMSAAEAAEANERWQEAQQGMWEEAERQRLDAEQYRQVDELVYGDVVSELRAAGRATDVATAEAAPLQAFYRTQIERSGLTPEEFLALYPRLRVRGSVPEGMQLRDVDELNRTLAAARGRREVRDRRRSLLEFISERGGINDAGGELRARDAETVRRGAGRKTLQLARRGLITGMRDMFGGSGSRDYSPDVVAAAAIEAGYLADDPVAQEYRAAIAEGREVPDITRAMWDAIDRELRGERQYSTQDVEDPRIAENDTLDQLEAYLNEIGSSLDDDDAAIRQAMQEAEAGRQYAKDQRGVIQLPAGSLADGESVVRLFETADLSTFLHESGHWFLAAMQDMAGRGFKHAADDMAVVRQWWRENAEAVAKDAGGGVTADDVIAAVDAGTTGDAAKDAAIDVGMQEQWARAFEAYLMEGRAPSVDLQGAFEKFRAWLIAIYRKLAGLGVSVSDDLRGVFDRMLASDAEIEQAQATAGGASNVFATAEQMGLTDEEYARFLKLRTQAENDAKARMLREAMEPVRREREKAYREEKARVREEVETRVNAYPMYRAIEWMGNRRWFGEGQPEEMPDMRMSKDILVQRYGEGVLSTLPRGKQTVYAVEGGADPDDIAGWFGFGSGDEMVRAMERAPKRTEAISAEVEREMFERHGDVLNDGTAEAAALDAVHTDRRGQWIAAELKAIVDVAGLDVKLTAKEARATARQTMARMRVRDAMNANRFLSAERKAAEEAARLGAILAREGVWMQNARRRVQTVARRAARGEASPDAVAAAIEGYNQRFVTTQTEYTVAPQSRTSPAGTAYTIPGGARTATSMGYNDLVAKLVEAKRRQLMNHALYMEARNVAAEVEKAERFVAKLGRASTRERIAGAGRRENAQTDYLAAIDELLGRYDFRRMSGAAEQRRGALNAYVEAMKAAGRENELNIPDDVLAQAERRPYRTVPVEELRGVIDALKNIEHTASRWDRLIDAQRERELDAVVTEIVGAFEQNMPKRPPPRVGSGRRTLSGIGREYLDIVLNAGTLLREIDGFKDAGPAFRNLKAPIDEAMGRLTIRKQDAAAKLEGLYSVYSKEERRRMSVREHMPALGFALSKWERIAIALNTGNAGNYDRLTNPKSAYAFTDAQVRAALATLDERDADFVQSVWDYLDSFRTDIAARERRKTGTEPKWIEPTPITIAGKPLTGGYYPIKYDPSLSARARDLQTLEISDAMRGGQFGKAQTRNGHTKARSGAMGAAVELDMSVLHRHVNQVIYDLELSEPVANSWRILQDWRVREAFIAAGRQPDFDALETWLKDVAEGELRSADLLGRTARTLKTGFTTAKLAFNFATVAMQITGVAQTMVVVGKKDFARGVQASLRPGIGDEIAAKSSFMSTRQTTFNKDIFDLYTDPNVGPVASRWTEAKTNWLAPTGFWLMTKVQWYLVDIPTWMAGYQQGLRRFGNDEARAIAHADDIVKRAQASGLFSDRSAIERGSLNSRQRQSDVVRLFTTLASYMFAKLNVAYERSMVASRTIRQEGPSLRAAQEAASWAVDMAFLFTLEAVLTAAIKGGLPGGDDDDDEDGAWPKFLAKETAFSVMGTMPFVRDMASIFSGFSAGGAYGAILGEFAKPIQQVAQGEVDKALVKSVISGTGLVTGIPATAINRVVDAGWRQSEGEDVSPAEYLLGASRN